MKVTFWIVPAFCIFKWNLVWFCLVIFYSYPSLIVKEFVWSFSCIIHLHKFRIILDCIKSLFSADSDRCSYCIMFRWWTGIPYINLRFQYIMESIFALFRRIHSGSGSLEARADRTAAAWKVVVEVICLPWRSLKNLAHGQRRLVTTGNGSVRN